MAINCRVVTPDKTYFDGSADSVVVPAWNGEMGFMSNHAPLIARLGYGVMRVKTGGNTARIAIFGGFVKVRDNTVVILAGGAENAGDIDRDEARQDLDEAKKTYNEKRPPAVNDIEAAEIKERLVRAEARYAAVTGQVCPIYQVES